jgi:cellulose synthase/poly-beta-1,6-N-acetylglucosamine synthase-like glycosyltransferase
MSNLGPELRPEEAPEVSFVVIAHNEAPRIGRSLWSIAAQSAIRSFEVLVVDDGSTDGTGEVAAALRATVPSLKVLRHETNLGRGAARATGAGAARGRFIAMVDADIVLPPRWWATCRTYLGTYEVVGGIAVPDGDVAYLCRRTGLPAKPTKPSSPVAGSNAAFRAEALRAIGFDRSLREGEDVAIAHSLQLAGCRLCTITDLVVEHQEGKDLRKTLAWLFASGIGATRQLATYRALRLPDLAFIGFLASLLTGGLLWRRPARGALALFGYPFLAAAAHVRQRLELDRHHPERALHAVCLDALLLSSYFLGRAAGLAKLVQQRWGCDPRALLKHP